MSTVQDRPVQLVGRSTGIDALRGLAIACMIVDHVALVTDSAPLLRLTVGRLAMPLFFIVAGHLVRRVTSRHLVILAVGLVLPAVVPFVESPNVLVWYVLGAGIIVGTARLGWSPWWPIVAALALAANGFPLFRLGTGYDGLALVALMCVGQLLPRSAFEGGERLPRVLAVVGRFPLTWYLGHLLWLVVILSAFGA